MPKTRTMGIDCLKAGVPLVYRRQLASELKNIYEAPASNLQEDEVFFDTLDAAGVVPCSPDSRFQSPDSVLSASQEPYILSIQGGVEDGSTIFDAALGEPLVERLLESANDSKTEESFVGLEDYIDTSSQMMETSDAPHSWSNIWEGAASPVSVVPEMENEIPADIRLASEIEQLKVPQTKTRRPKVYTPADKRTKAWLKKRERNNKAAKANRDREKAAKLAAKERHRNLLNRNRSMREEVAKLEAERDRLIQQRDARSSNLNQSVNVPDILADIFEDLPTDQYSLSPPVPLF